MQMITHKSQLLAFLKRIGYDKPPDRIAVEAHIFTPEGKVILEKRGQKVRDEVGKLEGVGGSIGNHNDLHRALFDRISCELGPRVQVEIDQLLEVRPVQFEDRNIGLVDWVVVSYLCRLSDGQPIIVEPDKIESLHELTLDELYAMDEAQLSRSTVIARTTYQEEYGRRPYYQALENSR